ncbi:MAG: hypothetical protein J5855_00605 [Mailhella sp.]|nr:hypothetical protein [Mailhella sp.]
MEFRKKDVRRFIDEAAHDIPRLICSNLEGPEKEIFIYEVFDTHGNGSVWIDKENGIELGVSLDKTLFDESATWDMDDIDFSFSISSRTLDRFLNELEGCL